MFRETRDRTVSGVYPRLLGDGSDPAIATIGRGAPTPPIITYAYRSLDRQYILRDARLGDRSRPVLHRAHSEERQTYVTTLLTEVPGSGPAAMAAASVPDLHHFRGSFGGKHVIPLYRDAEAAEANVTGGLLERISEAHGAEVTAERLFAYAYGILAQPAYVERFWDELEQPPPRLPITKDAALFAQCCRSRRAVAASPYLRRALPWARPPARDVHARRRRATPKQVPPTPLPDKTTRTTADERVLARR